VLVMMIRKGTLDELLAKGFALVSVSKGVANEFARKADGMNDARQALVVEAARVRSNPND
jgi:hypothetical protein